MDLQNAGMRQSGVYYLQIRGTTYWFLKVYCEQDIADGGWTVSSLRKKINVIEFCLREEIDFRKEFSL